MWKLFESYTKRNCNCEKKKIGEYSLKLSLFFCEERGQNVVLAIVL